VFPSLDVVDPFASLGPSPSSGNPTLSWTLLGALAPLAPFPLCIPGSDAIGCLGTLGHLHPCHTTSSTVIVFTIVVHRHHHPSAIVIRLIRSRVQ
jgi:hypothetical protein